MYFLSKFAIHSECCRSPLRACHPRRQQFCDLRSVCVKIFRLRGLKILMYDWVLVWIEFHAKFSVFINSWILLRTKTRNYGCENNERTGTGMWCPYPVAGVQCIQIYIYTHTRTFVQLKIKLFELITIPNSTNNLHKVRNQQNDVV